MVESVVATAPPGHEVRIPTIGLGTWRLRGRVCQDAVAHALSVGYRHLDTARMYGNEREVGAGLRASGVDRDEVFVVTKVRPGDADREGVRREVEASLRELGLDRIDLLLLHAPGRVPVEETMEAFREQQELDRVVEIGVSNFDVDGLQRASAAGPIVCVQNEYRPGYPQGPVLDWCRRHGVVLVAYSPLLLRGRARRAVEEVAEAHGRPWPQVALRWLVQQEQVAVIPRSSDATHREHNLEVFDFALSDDEMAWLATV